MTDEERARLITEKAEAGLRLARLDISRYRLGDVDARLEEYVREVAGNPARHNLWEQLAVERFFRMADRYGINRVAVQRFFTFYEGLYFPGKRGYQCYRLTPVQCFQFASVYAFWDGGKRIVRECVLYVPRKFSKTTGTASFALYDLITGESNGEIYIGANSQDQARKCFDVIRGSLMRFDSHGIVESVVTSEMPAAIIDLVNDALFTTEGTYTDTKDGKEKNKAVVGPFVKAAASAVQFAGAVPTRKELLKMKKTLLTCCLNLVAPCWVLSPDMAVELEDTKVDQGSGRFLLENGMLLGWPVFLTNAIGEGNIGLGDWAYQAAGFFDSMNLIVDPYTLTRKNAVDFVLNARFGTVTLYDEAFILGKAKAKGE